MSYKSYSQQIYMHIMFLKSKGFDIDELKVNADFVRCRQIDNCQYRGELVYKTRTAKLNNGLLGVQTWYRGPHGESSSFRTYGFGQTENDNIVHLKVTANANPVIDIESHNAAGRKAYGFWVNSAVNGRSEYLERKKVGYYGIRFRSSVQYGDVAIIPMVDAHRRLWSYQMLNPNGTKLQPKNARTEGLFHVIGTPVDGQPLGIAESYVTTASCFELTGIPTVCAFSCQNLKSVAKIFKQRYPKSRLVIFADNDIHLEASGATNQGRLKALEVIKAVGGVAQLVIPEFDSLKASKECSDWNDMIHHMGMEFTKTQIEWQLRKNTDQ